MPPVTPEALFGQLLAADPGRPFVTYYDEATGERSELSRKSLANWVAKTHFLLRDELLLEVGDTALIALPPHWISVPIVLGALTAGLEIVKGGPTEVTFAAPDRATPGTDVYVIAPDSAAVGLGERVPDGTLDYVAEVRPQADAWSGVQLEAGPDDPCLPGLSRAAAVGAAQDRAAGLGATDGARLLSTRDWTTPADWIDTILVPLVVGGSIVFVRNADEPTVERRFAQERATVRVR